MYDKCKKRKGNETGEKSYLGKRKNDYLDVIFKKLKITHTSDSPKISLFKSYICNIHGNNHSICQIYSCSGIKNPKPKTISRYEGECSYIS